jgi:hypothetical protein
MDESFRGVGGLVAANIEMSVDKPPQAELYADTYQPFRSCLGDVAFNCLGSRMSRSAASASHPNSSAMDWQGNLLQAWIVQVAEELRPRVFQARP